MSSPLCLLDPELNFNTFLRPWLFQTFRIKSIKSLVIYIENQLLMYPSACVRDRQVRRRRCSAIGPRLRPGHPTRCAGRLLVSAHHHPHPHRRPGTVGHHSPMPPPPFHLEKLHAPCAAARISFVTTKRAGRRDTAGRARRRMQVRVYASRYILLLTRLLLRMAPPVGARDSRDKRGLGQASPRPPPFSPSAMF